MSGVAGFGIINHLDEDKDYSKKYEPEKYHCVGIDDDLIDEWWPGLEQIPTFFHSYNRPEHALARWGVTLIPPQSVEALYKIVASDERSKTNKELMELMAVLRKAIAENKYVIHYGI